MKSFAILFGVYLLCGVVLALWLVVVLRVTGQWQEVLKAEDEFEGTELSDH